jgi:hypothetical protein
VDFPCVFIVGFLHTRHSAGLEHATLFDQFIDAFGVRLGHSGNLLGLTID